MQGSGNSNANATDWMNKASPDELITAATTLFGRISALGPTYQDQFVQKVRNDPQASRLIEQLSGVTT